MKERNKSSFWMVGYTILILMVGTNLPSPLYSVYKESFGFSNGIMSLIFAIYALILLPTLMVCGRLSDRVGRKKMMLFGLVMAALGSFLFTFAGSLTWLFVARISQGFSVGLLSGAATAALAELHPKQDRKHAALIASLATAGGTAIGPILSGILAEYSTYPTKLPFLLHLGLVIPAFIGLLIMKEPIKFEALPKAKTEKGIPKEILRPFKLAAVTVFMAWSVTALFMALVPSFVSTLLNVKNLMITGGVVFLMLSVSTVTQIILKQLNSWTSMKYGLHLLTLGLVGICLSVPAQSITLLLISTCIVGIGQGMAFMGSLSLVNIISPAERRADIASVFYFVLYLGVGLPVLGVGFGAQLVGLYQAIVIFSCVIGASSLFLSRLISTQTAKKLSHVAER